jgi:hypothetical protein
MRDDQMTTTLTRQAMTTPAGNEAKDQYMVKANGCLYFESYGSKIVRHHLASGKITLDVRYWDYSTTTGKYRNLFLGENKATTKKKIDSGEYELANLNHKGAVA